MIVFFFKQKTAYEMRISDWSSDVCSSDLPEIDRRSAHAPMAPGAIKRDAMPAQVVGKLQQAFRRRAEREMRLVIDGLGDRVAGFGILLLGDFNDKVSDLIEKDRKSVV